MMKILIQKYKKTPIEVRASFWYMICNILQKGVSFIIIPIYTRLLTTNEYGNYTVFQSWKDIIVIFATLNLSSGVFTKGLVEYENERDSYTSSMQSLSTLVTVIVYIIYIALNNQLSLVLHLRKSIITLMFLYYIFNPSILFWSVRQRVENRYAKMITVTMLLSILTPIVSLFLLLLTDLREESLIFGTLWIQIIIGAIFYIYHLLKGRLIISKKYWSESLKFNIPLIPHYLSLIILSHSDRIMINNICGNSEAGIYSLVSSISQAMYIFTGAINSTIVPWTYNQLKKKKYQKIRKVSNIICILMCFISLIIIAVAPEIVWLMGGKQYIAAIWCTPPIVLSVYFTFCYNMFSTVEFYVGITKYIAIASTIGALLNVLLNALFLPVFGYIAAAYTTLACYLFFTVMHFLFMKKVFSVNVYNIRNLIIMSLLLGIMSFVFTLTYYSFTARYLLLVILMIVIFVKRSLFINTLKSLRGDSNEI